MGWDNLYKSWKNNLPERFDEDQYKIFDNVMYTLVQPIIDYVRNEAKECTPTEDQNLVVSLLRLWRALLKVYDDDSVYPGPLDKK
jgi:dynein heavy chain